MCNNLSQNRIRNIVLLAIHEDERVFNQFSLIYLCLAKCLSYVKKKQTKKKTNKKNKKFDPKYSLKLVIRTLY